MATTEISAFTSAALQHLKTIKPKHTWTVESKASGAVRLLKNNSAVSDGFFLDLYRDPASGCVVGLLRTPDNSDGKVEAQVLIDKNGKQSTRNEMVTVSPIATTTTAPPRMKTSSSFSSASGGDTSDLLSDVDNRLMLRFGAACLAALLVLRVLAQFANLFAVILPLTYLYLVSTCPLAESFDAKKELKRAIRGEFLPDDDPRKPKTRIAKAWTRFTANVATEMATASGYETTLQSMAGAVIIAKVYVALDKSTSYWVGANNKWWYVWTAEVPKDTDKRA